MSNRTAIADGAHMRGCRRIQGNVAQHHTLGAVVKI